MLFTQIQTDYNLSVDQLKDKIASLGLSPDQESYNDDETYLITEHLKGDLETLLAKPIAAYGLELEVVKTALASVQINPNQVTYTEAEITTVLNYLDRTYHPLMQLFAEVVDQYNLSLDRLESAIADLGISIADNVSPQIKELVTNYLDRLYDPILQKFPDLVRQHDLDRERLASALSQIAPDLDLDRATDEQLKELNSALERKFHPFGYLADRYNISVAQIKADLAAMDKSDRPQAAILLEQKYNPLWYSSSSIEEFARIASIEQKQNISQLKEEIHRRQLLQFAQACNAYTENFIKELHDSGTAKNLARETVDRVLGKFDPEENLARIQHRIQMLPPLSQNNLLPSDPSSNESLDQS